MIINLSLRLLLSQLCCEVKALAANIEAACKFESQGCLKFDEHQDCLKSNLIANIVSISNISSDQIQF